MMRKLQSRQWVMFIALIAIASLSRVLPHPPNFTPIGGMALFAGAIMPNVALAISLPLASLILGDYLFLGGGYEGAWVVYLSFIGITLLGRLSLNDKSHPVKLIGSALLASTFFFLTTNLVFWYQSGLYSLDAKGFLTSYTMALPFFGNAIIGDIIFTSFFFAVWKWFSVPTRAFAKKAA